MAEALLKSRLQAAGVEARVHSAGLLDDGREASEHGVDVMSTRGIDASAHRSRRMTADMLREADLVLAMAREHVREAVLLVPDAWPRTFTLKEFVRRATDAGPRQPSESFEAWLNRLHTGRRTADLIGASTEDDVDDPIGQPRPAYERTAEELDALVGRLAKLAWGA